MKFHVNSSGEAGKCSATQGKCPFGGESEHYTSAEAAREAFEKAQANPQPLRKRASKITVDLTQEFPYDHGEIFNKLAAKKAIDAKLAAETDPAARELLSKQLRQNYGRNSQANIEKLRLSILNHGDKSWKESVAAGGFTKPNELELKGLESVKVPFVLQLGEISPKLLEKISELPARYVPILDVAKSHMATAIAVAEEVEKKNPGWTPNAERLAEVSSNGQVRERPAAGYWRREGEPASMQHVEPELSKMLGRYVIDTYGADKAEKFWSAVKNDQKSVNRPTLGNFVNTHKRWLAGDES